MAIVVRPSVGPFAGRARDRFPWDFFSQNATLTLTHAYASTAPHVTCHTCRACFFLHQRGAHTRQEEEGGERACYPVVRCRRCGDSCMSYDRGEERSQQAGRLSLVRDERTIDELQRCRGMQPLKLLNRA
eukprot:scaffold25490_cov109-Isochrysis_galbana.AAC.3